MVVEHGYYQHDPRARDRPEDLGPAKLELAEVDGFREDPPRSQVQHTYKGLRLERGSWKRVLSGKSYGL